MGASDCPANSRDIAAEGFIPRALWALALFLLVAAVKPVAAAATDSCSAADRLDRMGRYHIDRVGETGTLLLANGQEARLAGIEMVARSGDAETVVPLAGEAYAALSKLALNQPADLYVGRQRHDRYGRLLTHPCLSIGGWLQGSLLARGLARVATTPRDQVMALEMLSIERRARSERAGIWDTRFFRVRNPHETRRDIDSFQIVEGRVVNAAIVRGRAYLNFGPNWRTDFTFGIAPRTRKLFERAGIDPAALTGRRVRGRGWVTLRNGPYIELTHVAQLEVLPE